MRRKNVMLKLSPAALLAGISCGTALICSNALAAELAAPSMEQVLNSVVFTQQSDTAHFQVGPRWSEQYGWAIDARGAMMLSEALAVGLVVTYGENDRELVFNTGLQLDDKTIIIGTLAGHQQNVPVGDDREWVDQLEGGVSLRSDDGVGFIGGYEINAYGTSSSTDGSLDTGTMLGAEANLLLHPIAGMTARLGAGYEKIDWADGDPTEGWTANLNVTQKVGDALTLKLGIDLGQSEDRYTAGTELLIADTGSSNSRLGLDYSYIVDKDGGDDEQRLTAYWRMGIGEDSKAAASTAVGYAGEVSLTPEPGHTHDRILSAVMEKPDYLPANVLAKAESGSAACPLTILTPTGGSFDSNGNYVGGNYPAGDSWSYDGGHAESYLVYFSAPVGFSLANFQDTTVWTFNLTPPAPYSNNVAPSLTEVSAGIYRYEYEDVTPTTPLLSGNVLFNAVADGLSCSFDLPRNLD
jgi:hypothetical protein